MSNYGNPCQYNKRIISWSCGEYNTNNAWYYNGNNGRLNNNNKYNTYRVRPVLERNTEKGHLSDNPIVSYEEIYDSCVRCRRRKGNKPSYLYFADNRRDELINLWYEINNRELTFKPSIAFIITNPKIREVMAADFRDRVAQTYLVQELLPFFERYESPNSYSCRVGKGGLKAALDFNKMVKEVSENYTKDCYLFSLDFRTFFPAIDIEFWAPKLVKWIDENYVGNNKDIIKYLAEKIYLHKPQNDYIVRCPLDMWQMLDPLKSIIFSTTGLGIPIGNVTSQTIANFITTPVLKFLDEHGIKYVCYTDDIKGIVTDKEKFMKLLPEIRKFAWEECRLKLHPKKFDIQHYSKGIRIGAYKVRFDRMLPNNRIAHNFIHKINKYITFLNEDENKVWKFKDKFVSVVNSYLGMLKHCNSYRLRKEGIDLLKNSRWAKYLNFPEDMLKVELKEEYKTVNVYKRKAAEQRRLKHLEQMVFENEIFSCQI